MGAIKKLSENYKKYAYFVWGINNDTHEIVGTTFNQYCEYNKELYQNYLARNLSPSVNFSFEEEKIDGNRVVVLVIPAAEEIPTAFKEKRYIRIGSSKAALKDYPKREIQLFRQYVMTPQHLVDSRIISIYWLLAKTRGI